MKQCLALVVSSSEPWIWTKCTMPPVAGDKLCASHRDALDGALIGLFAAQKYLRRGEKPVKKQRGRKT